MNKREFDQVLDLTHFLEKYEEKAKDARNKTFAFQKSDMNLWKSYFEALIKPGVLRDGMAFGAENNNTNLGIGIDGECYSDEFYQLLMQCYKYLYMALSSGEIFLKHKGWVVSDKESGV